MDTLLYLKHILTSKYPRHVPLCKMKSDLKSAIQLPYWHITFRRFTMDQYIFIHTGKLWQPLSIARLPTHSVEILVSKLFGTWVIVNVACMHAEPKQTVFVVGSANQETTKMDTKHVCCHSHDWMNHVILLLFVKCPFLGCPSCTLDINFGHSCYTRSTQQIQKTSCTFVISTCNFRLDRAQNFNFKSVYSIKTY